MLVEFEIFQLGFGETPEQIASELRDFVASPDFPCVGAKAALRRHQLEILVASDIRRSGSDQLIAQRLQNFAIRHDGNDTMFVSQAVVFSNHRPLSEGEFETHLWQRLTALHAIDKRHFQWDPKVDSDPGFSALQHEYRRQGLFRRRPASQRQPRCAPLQVSDDGFQSARPVREAA